MSYFRIVIEILKKTSKQAFYGFLSGGALYFIIKKGTGTANSLLLILILLLGVAMGVFIGLIMLNKKIENGEDVRFYSKPPPMPPKPPASKNIHQKGGRETQATIEKTVNSHDTGRGI